MQYITETLHFKYQGECQMKNLIISILLVLLLNTQDGWAVEGIMRVYANVTLIVLIDSLIVEFERMMKYGSRYNP